MATITEKSRAKEIIDRLQGIIKNASSVPLASGKVSVYKDEVQSLLTELRSQMDMELKTYREVNDRKGKIINEAKKEAEQIIYQAERTASRMRVTKRTTNVAPLDYNMLDEEERKALDNANQIYAASLIYTDEMLTEITDMITDAYQNIRGDYEIILQVLEEKISTISNNREELMMGLQEMEMEDRSQQILEIGQLLSNELYNARMKARMNSDEYEDGSVQLSLDLQEEQEEKARQAEEKAQRTAQALAQMTAERDALMATVEQMKREGMSAMMREARPVRFLKESPGVNDFISETQQDLTARKNERVEEDVEYEIEYVTEEELEDGEEYEIEYVDEEELEDGEEYEIEYVDEGELEDGEEYEIEYVDEEELEDGEEYEIEYVDEEELEDGEEYEIEYADEEELEDGEEYEIEYVDEKEPEEEDKVEGVGKEEPEKEDEIKTVNEEKPEQGDRAANDSKEDLQKSEEIKEQSENVPIIPHYEKKKKTADSEELQETQDTNGAKRNENQKTDENSDGYVQATMKFDEKFEIIEF